MGVAARELAERYDRANTRLRIAIDGILQNEGKDLLLTPTTSYQLQFEYSPKSEPGIPGPIKRLVRSAYMQPLPISAIRAGMVYDPDCQPPEGESHVLTVDIVVREQQIPSQIAHEQGMIAVGKIEAFLGPIMTISPDFRPFKYAVDRSPMIPPKNGRDPEGSYRFGDFGPGVVEAVSTIIEQYKHYTDMPVPTEEIGRTRRALRAVQRTVYPKIGKATELPALRVESYHPGVPLFP